MPVSNTGKRTKPLHGMARLLLACLACATAGPAAAMPATNAAESLQARYAAMGGQLAHNQFQRPLHLDSTESPTQLRGDIYALMDFPFGAVSTALSDPAHWCDVLILHLNTKYCRALAGTAGPVLAVGIGKKYDQPADEAYRVNFAFQLVAASPGYLEVGLDAETGPLGTSDYRIRFEVVPVAGGRTFLHLAYSYSYGLVGRFAMQVYLATAGSGKIGFTITGKQANGEPDYIGGVRGLVERNTMRYYLAIDAYLGALDTPRSEQLGARLQTWFTSTERYPGQLHEMDRAAYLDMKRHEYSRQQAAQ